MRVEQCGKINEIITSYCYHELPRWLTGRDSTCQCRSLRRRGFNPWLQKNPGEGNGNPLQYSCLENPRDKGSWWVTVHGVRKSQTRLSILTHVCYHAFLIPSCFRISCLVYSSIYFFAFPFFFFFFLVTLTFSGLLKLLIFLKSQFYFSHLRNPNLLLKNLFLYYFETKKMYVSASGHRVGCVHFL